MDSSKLPSLTAFAVPAGPMREASYLPQEKGKSQPPAGACGPSEHPLHCADQVIFSECDCSQRVMGVTVKEACVFVLSMGVPGGSFSLETPRAKICSLKSLKTVASVSNRMETPSPKPC